MSSCVFVAADEIVWDWRNNRRRRRDTANSNANVKHVNDKRDGSTKAVAIRDMFLLNRPGFL